MQDNPLTAGLFAPRPTAITALTTLLERASAASLTNPYPSAAQVKGLPSFITAYSVVDDQRPSLPPLGHDLSRPSSTSTQASYTTHSQSRHGSNSTLQLPGLKALASLASSSASSAVAAAAAAGAGHSHQLYHHHDGSHSRSVPFCPFLLAAPILDNLSWISVQLFPNPATGSVHDFPLCLHRRGNCLGDPCRAGVCGLPYSRGR